MIASVWSCLPDGALCNNVFFFDFDFYCIRTYDLWKSVCLSDPANINDSHSKHN